MSPFSLSCAPWALTKVLKPVAALEFAFCLYRQHASDRQIPGQSLGLHGGFGCSI